MRIFAVDMSGGYLEVHFDRRLTGAREYDFRSAPTGTPEELSIEPLTKELLCALFDDTSGVDQVRVSSFRFIVWHSRAVPAEELLQRLAEVITSLGETLEFAPNSPLSIPPASPPEDNPLLPEEPLGEPSEEDN